MSPWYEASFGCEYLNLYAHRNLAEARANIGALMKLVPLGKDELLLDLCCGAGRHLLALYEVGFRRLVGLDLSAELLAVASESLAGMGGITLVRADMRYLPFKGCFSTVLSLFTSFGYFDEDQENRAVLTAVCQALRKGGVFVLDYLNREYVISHLVPSDEREVFGRRVHNIRRLTDNGRRVEKVTTVMTETGAQRQFFESVRLYSLTEMQEMFRSEGFSNVNAYGSLAGQSFGPDSERLVLIAEKG